jgi:hypothetical protein
MQLSLFDYAATVKAPWTDAERVKLFRMWRAGWSADTIAKNMFGRTAGAIRSEATRMNLQRREDCPNGRLRTCTYCSQNFFSTWNGHRRCGGCAEAVNMIAAVDRRTP